MMVMDFRGKQPDVDRAAFIADSAVIIGDVVMEEGASVYFGAVIRGDSGPIRIGRGSNIQDNCVLHCDAGGSLRIGEHVTVGHGAIVHGCTIGDGCMIGMGAVILNNAVIGDHCMVGAGALITSGKEFPAGSLIMGSPAKTVMPVTSEHLDMMKHGAQEYADFSQAYSRLCQNQQGSTEE